MAMCLVGLRTGTSFPASGTAPQPRTLWAVPPTSSLEAAGVYSLLQKQGVLIGKRNIRHICCSSVTEQLAAVLNEAVNCV